MTERLVIVGAGGFGREACDVAEAMNAAAERSVFEILGIVDDDPTSENLERIKRRGLSYLGTTAEWLASGRDAQYVVGIGSPAARRRIVENLARAGLKSATLCHPSASTGADVHVAAGAIICAGVRITNNVRIGQHVHLNLNTTVGHDTTIHDFVSINPLVAISGDCTIETGAMFGTGSVILQGLYVGEGAIVGASACVIRDVPPATTVKGVPAR